MKLFLLIFAFCLVEIYCAVSREETTVSDAERAEGYSCKSSTPELGLMRAGEKKVNYKPNLCGAANCGGDGTIRRTTCGAVSGPPECKLVRDMSKPYPECCPKIFCNDA